MAAIFQIRRGGSSYTSSLVSGELYLNTAESAFQVGTSGNPIKLLSLNTASFGDIILTGNISASGDIRIGGNIYLGNDTSSAQPDSISALGIFTTNLVPNGTIDLGTTTAKWNNVYANNISGAIAATNGVVSGSSQITSILDSLNTFSGSQLTQNTALGTITGSLIGSASNHEQRLGQIESKSGSYDTRFNSLATISGSLILTASANTISVTNLNTFSGSQLTQNTTLATISGSLILTASANTISVTNLNTFSGSQLSKDTTLATLTASYDGRFTTLATYTGSVETRFGILATLTGSNSIRLTNLETTTASLNVSVTNLNTFSGSQLTQNSALATTTGSLISSASADRISIAELNSYTSSLKTAITASGGNVTINGNLTVKGTTTQIDSTTLNIGDNIIELNGASSANGGLLVKDTTGASGSLLWDSTLDYWKGGTLANESKILLAGGDSVISSSAQLTQLNSFTGSQLTQNTNLATISGSLILTASANTISITNLNSFSGSQLSQNTALATISGSLISSASSDRVSITNINLTTASLNISVTNLNSFTSSQLTQNTTLGSYTGSVETRFGTLGTLTGSNAIRLTNLESTTASLNTSITNLNTFSSSQLSKDATLATLTASYDGRFTTLGTYTASVNQTTSSLNLYTASANTWSGTIDTRFTTLGTYTGSVNQTTSSLNSYTASISTSFGQFSSSYAADSASFDYRIDILDPGNLSGNLLTIQQSTASLNTFSASAKISITNLEAASSSYETKGRGIVSGSSQIIFSGISSLPTLVSGSSQVLGGSGVWSGSAQLPSGVVSGSSQVIGILDSLNTFSGSANTRFTEIGVVSGSLIASASAAKTTNDSQGVSITNLNLTTASLNTSVSNLNTSTSSYETKGRGIVSGSSQVLGGSGVASGSYETTGRSIISSSAQIVPLLPAGVVSGSTQIITANSITLGTHTTGNYVATITGTANQITVAGSGLETAAVTLSLPQSIATTSDVQFNNITASAGIRATGDIIAYFSSDERLKENVQPIQNALSKVELISGNTYDWKEGFDNIHPHKGNDVGVIAQEIEIVLPQVVINRDNGYKAVDYEKIVPLLIEAIKELSAKIKELENK
jgi:hypothetical protein